VRSGSHWLLAIAGCPVAVCPCCDLLLACSGPHTTTSSTEAAACQPGCVAAHTFGTVANITTSTTSSSRYGGGRTACRAGFSSLSGAYAAGQQAPWGVVLVRECCPPPTDRHTGQEGPAACVDGVAADANDGGGMLLKLLALSRSPSHPTAAPVLWPYLMHPTIPPPHTHPSPSCNCTLLLQDLLKLPALLNLPSYPTAAPAMWPVPYAPTDILIFSL
jgi:hypothetical protein